MKKKLFIISVLAALLILSGCGSATADKSSAAPEQPASAVEQEEQPSAEPEQKEEADQSAENEQAAQVENGGQDEQAEAESQKNGRTVVIDAGHQARQNSGQEPIGPGASQTKPKVSSGTQGKYTGVPEYQLNLDVALKLRDELSKRGYNVIMVRETNDVDISNSERAAVANNAHADAFIRIHADGAESGDPAGTMTMCQTASNPYNGGIYQQCRALSESVVNAVCEQTGAKNRGVMETDTMSGINWCQVPVTIVEMGYMTNQQEDTLMQTPDYQNKIAVGIANGIDRFLQ